MLGQFLKLKVMENIYYRLGKVSDFKQDDDISKLIQHKEIAPDFEDDDYSYLIKPDNSFLIELDKHTGIKYLYVRLDTYIRQMKNDLLAKLQVGQLTEMGYPVKEINLLIT